MAEPGLGVSELCDLKVSQVRLHDPNGSRLRIADAKTEAGVREVQVSPDLVDEPSPTWIGCAAQPVRWAPRPICSRTCTAVA